MEERKLRLKWKVKRYGGEKGRRREREITSEDALEFQ